MKPKYQYDTESMLMDEDPFIDPDFKLKPTYPMEEVFDQFCKELGQMYGLNDIREAVE